MNKILTALDNPEFHKRLMNIKGLNVYEKDIQYKEGIIDILKTNKELNVVIIYEKLSGEIKIQELIKEIKLINNEIKFIFILENKNENLEKILFNENIKNIFYNNEINFKEFINKIKNINYSEEENLKKEINKLNKIIFTQKKELIKYKQKNYKNKIIIISEDDIYSNIKSEIINILNKKYKIINFNFNKFNKRLINQDYYIFILKNNFEEMRRTYKLIKDNKIQKYYIIIMCEKKGIKYKVLKGVFGKNKVLGKINNKYKLEKRLKNKLGGM